jgi:hypothetical protein
MLLGVYTVTPAEETINHTGSLLQDSNKESLRSEEQDHVDILKKNQTAEE